MAMAPAIVVYLFTQRWVMEGVTQGAVKRLTPTDPHHLTPKESETVSISVELPRHDRPSTGALWWRQAVVYQIYPRSFADANGDGIGDLRGHHLPRRLPGRPRVDAVWLSPFYPSALADGGYDVDDYRDVDPRLGTLADFDELVSRAARRRHQARSSTSCPTTPPTGTRGSRRRWPRRAGLARARPLHLPRRHRTGRLAAAARTGSRCSAAPPWQRVADGQWYLHLFAPEQPDLNWDNPEVRDDFLTHPAVLGRPRRRRLPRRRRPRPGQGPARAAARRRPSSTGQPDGRSATRSWDRDEVHDIYARVARRCSTSTTRRGPRSPRRGCTPPGAPATPARRASARRSTSTCCRPTSTPPSFRRIITDNLAEAAGVRGILDLGVLQPRRGPARHPLRAAERRPSTGSGQDGRPGCSPTAPQPVLDVDWACAGPGPPPC